MPIISAYVREDWYYSVQDLQKIFCFNIEIYHSQDNADIKLKRYIKELMSRDILKVQKSNSVADIDSEFIFENYNDNELLSNNAKYKFDFVGIVICQNIIAYVYPKYLGESNTILTQNPVIEMQQVMQVIEKYSRDKTKQDIRNVDLFSDIDDNGKINILSVMLYLLEDYSSNGEYEDDETVLDINGSGEIYWQKTIDETYPIFFSDQPYYVELYTRKKRQDDTSYIKRLHAYTVTQCSREIEQIGLTFFFNLPSVDISNEDRNIFGDTDYLISRLDSEISRVFNDRKLMILHAIRLYFSNRRILSSDTEIQIIGTRSFNMIWEDVCAKVFCNQRGDAKTRHPNVDEIDPKIDYTIINKYFDKKPPTLIELIKQPIWRKYGKGNSGIPKKSLNPDYLRFEKDTKNNKYVFYILDAKYYCPVWEANNIQGQPDVEDIAKQYLYYLAYRNILVHYHVFEVKNYFLMPKRKNDPDILGFVKLDMLRDLGLGVIEIRMISPEELYKNYLNGTHLNLSELH